LATKAAEDAHSAFRNAVLNSSPDELAALAGSTTESSQSLRALVAQESLADKAMLAHVKQTDVIVDPAKISDSSTILWKDSGGGMGTMEGDESLEWLSMLESPRGDTMN